MVELMAAAEAAQGGRTALYCSALRWRQFTSLLAKLGKPRLQQQLRHPSTFRVTIFVCISRSPSFGARGRKQAGRNSKQLGRLCIAAGGAGRVTI